MMQLVQKVGRRPRLHSIEILLEVAVGESDHNLLALGMRTGGPDADFPAPRLGGNTAIMLDAGQEFSVPTLRCVEDVRYTHRDRAPFAAATEDPRGGWSSRASLT